MKANKAAAMLVSELYPKRIIDESAETLAEICANTGADRHALSKDIQEKVRAGIVEQVWKRSGRNIICAYRIKK